MAQQITSKNSIGDTFINKTNYTDNQSGEFGSILDVANKSITSTLDSSLSNSNFTNNSATSTYNNTAKTFNSNVKSSTSKTDFNSSTNPMNNLKSNTNTKSSTSETDFNSSTNKTNNAESNKVTTKNENKSQTEKTSNNNNSEKTEHSNNSTDLAVNRRTDKNNQNKQDNKNSNNTNKDESNDSNKISDETKNVDTKNQTDTNENTQTDDKLTEDINDVITKYLYFSDTDKTDSGSKPVSNVPIDANNTTTTDVNNTIAIDTNLAKNTSLTNTTPTDTSKIGATVQADKNINLQDLGSDKNINNNNQNKDSISQKMIDELNVTITDAKDNTQNTPVETNNLLNSQEQLIKDSLNQKDTDTNAASTTNTENVETSTVAETIISNDKNVDKNPTIDDKNDENKIDNSTTTETSDTLQDSSSTDTTSNSNHNENKDFTKQSNDSAAEDIKKDTAYETSTETETTDDKIDTIIGGKTASSKTSSDIGTFAVHTNTSTIGGAKTSETTTQTQSSNLSKYDIVAQIHDKLQTIGKNGFSKMSMELNPDSLGKVSIHISNSKDGMVAEMVVNSQSVKDALENNLSTLKDNLASQGVTVNTVTVKLSETESHAEMDYTEQENSSGNKQDTHQQNGSDEDTKEKFEQTLSSKNNNLEENENNIN